MREDWRRGMVTGFILKSSRYRQGRSRPMSGELTMTRMAGGTSVAPFARDWAGFARSGLAAAGLILRHALDPRASHDRSPEAYEAVPSPPCPARAPSCMTECPWDGAMRAVLLKQAGFECRDLRQLARPARSIRVRARCADQDCAFTSLIMPAARPIDQMRVLDLHELRPGPALTALSSSASTISGDLEDGFGSSNFRKIAR